MTGIDKAWSKGNKRKTEESWTTFLNKVFNYDLTKFWKERRIAAVVGAHGKLYSQSSLKIPAAKHTSIFPLTLFRMGLFRAAHGGGGGEGGGQKAHSSLKSFTHPTILKLGTVIPYEEDT